MNRALPVLDNLRIASPCSESWSDMVGDKRRRFCQSCEKNVYDLTVMTPVEIVALIEKTEGKFCGRLYQRRDGRVLTEDCPVGLARVLREAKRKTLRTAIVALGLAAAAAAYFMAREPKVIAKAIDTIEQVMPPEPMPGGIAIDPQIMGEMEMPANLVDSPNPQ